jgi:Spy/CpxP family protein refolding chaperone
MTMIRTALHVEGLTDDQKTKIGALVEQMPAVGREATRGRSDSAFGKTLTDAVKAGKVDAKVFEAQLEAMSKKRQEQRAKRAKVLNDLHAVLTPEQRKSVAGATRTKLSSEPDGAPGGGRGMGRPVAHPSGGSSALPGGSSSAHAGGGVAMRRAGGFGFDRVIADLKLTQEQQKKVDELTKKMREARPTEEQRVARRETAKKNLLAMLDAFEKDTFDATTLEISKAIDDDWSARSKAMTEHLSALVAILTDEQRSKLAERVSGGRDRLLFDAEPDDSYKGMLAEPDPDEADKDDVDKDKAEKDDVDKDKAEKDESVK